jgi:catecholate siderophore receptor
MSVGGNLRKGLIASVKALGAAGVITAPDAAAQMTMEETEQVLIEGRYQIERLSAPEYALPLIDLPQSVNVITDQLLEEQGRRTLRDALRNVSGISLHAGEGNPPGGGDALSIRGFSARDDLYVDGSRDPGNYFRDPFNADRIEVTKGPASAFAGRGNTGGTVNIVSRLPMLAQFMEGEASVGTHSFYRATADMNFILSEPNGIALRLNGMVHSADEPGRDVTDNKRWGIAPSLAIGLGGPAQLTLSYLHQDQDDQPDFGLPNARNFSLAGSGFEGRVAPVDTSNYYGYSTDYRNVAVDIATARVDYAFGDVASIRSQLRWGRTHNDSIMSAPRFVGTVTTLDETTTVASSRKPRDQVDDILINQTDLTIGFNTGPLSHTFVTGFELSSERSENDRRLDANGPAMNLFEPVLLAAPEIPYNGTRARLDVDTTSFYVFDTIEIGPQWRLVGGLRYDDVDTRVQGFDDTGATPGFVTDLEATDSELSSNAAVVFKPTEATSLYVAYGNAFEPSGRAEVVQLAGGNNAPPVTPGNFFVDPELSEAWEAGFKWDALDGTLSFTSAIFQITRTNARTPGLNPGDPLIVLDGEQRVRGVELNLVGDVAFWHFFGTYSYLDGEVTESNRPIEIGQKLDHLPEHSASLWVSYRFENGMLLGGGIQYVGERTSNIRTSATENFVITVPEYTVIDAFGEYPLTDIFSLRLNVYNITDETYFQSFSSGQSIPAAARSAVLSLHARF